MTKRESIRLFEGSKVRTIWDDKEERWYSPLMDVISVLADGEDPDRYWGELKNKLNAEGSDIEAMIHKMKIRDEGGLQLTEVIDIRTFFRIVQSNTSSKAESFKQWLAELASTRIDQINDPELSIKQAIDDYRKKGYTKSWITQRIRSIEARKELTDEWERTGVKQGSEYARLTDTITQGWSGLTTRQYKVHKGLVGKENLRDNMTTVEMALNTLAEASSAAISRVRNPKGFKEQIPIAKEGGDVAKKARYDIEEKLGRSVISKAKASDYLKPIDSIENDQVDTKKTLTE